MKKFTLWGFVVASLGATGCALEAGEEVEPVGSAQEPITFTDFFWSKGSPAVNMGTSVGRACFLVSVSGDFEGLGEFVQVFVGQGSNFFLGGGSGQANTINAWARCRALDPGTSLTNTFLWQKGQPNQPMISGGSCFLTMVSGQFNGGGEKVQAFPDGNGQWWLGGTSQAPNSLKASARCITGELLQDPGFWQQGSSRVTLRIHGSNNHSSACFLSGMRGQFEGGGESINTWYDTSQFRWFLGGTSSQSSVSAWAGCIN